MTVRWRLTLVATIVFGVAFAAAAWGLVTVVHDNLVSGIKETNEQELALLANQLEQGTPVDDLRPQYVDVCVQRPNGQCEYVGTGVAVPRNPPAGYRQDQRVVETEGGRVTLVAQRSLAEVDSAVSNLKTVMWFAVPALIALVGAAVWFLAGRALRPVEVIRSEAEAITGSTLDRRVPEPRAKDEVGRLARTMNAMLDRLETSSQKQRQFVSDASHELRSPIASIRTNLEVALRHQDQADWPAIAERALADDARLEVMVSDLLDLARLDEAEGPAPLATLPEVDLDELVLDDTVQQRRVPVDTSRVSAGR
ncbi:MAG: histidine kinase dimerization/phospho-acceptor domain-containing protein, partial [Acidimicrobiia bacterium]